MDVNARRQLNVWSVALVVALVVLALVGASIEGAGAAAAVVAVPVFLLLAWVTVLRARA